MKAQEIKRIRKIKRVRRTRGKILKFTKFGKRPRLSVFRSNKYFYAQIIDDAKGVTLVNVNGLEFAGEKSAKTDKARKLGKMIAEKAIKMGIKQIVFDKGSYRYHGRVKSFADAAREGGLIF